MTELAGTRALVTGATSGLGLAMARALSAAGARVAITSRDAERAGHAAADVGPGALGLALDVRDDGAVAAGVAEVWDRFGGIDLLVNNTGTGMVPDDTPAEARERLLDSAIMGPPIVWLASPAAAGVHHERIVAAEFEQWWAARENARCSGASSSRCSAI